MTDYAAVWILALIASAYYPHRYSWCDGCDKAWRNIVRTLGSDVTARQHVTPFEHWGN